MKILFVRDYRGVLAYEHEYKDGDTADLPDDIAQHLIDKGRAVSVAKFQAGILADLEAAEVAKSQAVEPEVQPVALSEDEPEPPKKRGKG